MSPAAETLTQHAGWQASLHLGFRRSGTRTILAERSRRGPLAVQRPFYPEGDVCHVYLLHPPGGVVGGDSIDIDADISTAAHALVTTPGATKFYRSAGKRAQQRQLLCVDEGAMLEWLPHENILFDGADVATETRIALTGSARVAWLETYCLGRPVIDEPFARGALDSQLRIERDGRPLFVDRLRVRPDNRRRRSLMADYPVCATLVLSGASTQHVDICRGLLCDGPTDHAAATLLDDLLIVRYLGTSTETAQRMLRGVWQHLRGALFGRVASVPRIWAT